MRRLIFVSAAIAATVFHSAAAQQVIAKGSWVLESSAYPGFGALGVFKTSSACIQGQQDLAEKANLLDAQDQQNMDQTVASNASYLDESIAIQKVSDADALVHALQTANCIQQ